MPLPLHPTSPRFLLIGDAEETAIETAAHAAGCRLVRISSPSDAHETLDDPALAGAVITATLVADCIEVAHRIREDSRAGEMPLVIIMADGDAALAGEAYALGGVEIVFSPVDPAALRAKLEELAAFWRVRCELLRAREQLEGL